MISDLYALHYQEISRFLFSLTKNRAQAEDLTQDTFMRAMGHADTFLDMSAAQCRSWLYRTARNLFIDQTRRKNRETLGVLREEGEEDDTSHVYVAQMLSILPPEDRALFYLRHFEGMNATELSAQFGLPASTIRSRLTKCRGILARQLNQ